MGLNTIFSYVYRDQLEPSKGTWDSSSNNDIARYFKTAQDQGMNASMKGEFPSWLSEVPEMVVRANIKPRFHGCCSFLH